MGANAHIEVGKILIFVHFHPISWVWYEKLLWNANV